MDVDCSNPTPGAILSFLLEFYGAVRFLCTNAVDELRVTVVDLKIVNVYNDSILPNKGLKGGWGNAFHVTMGEKEVLFDVGYKGGTLMQNIHALGIDVDKIEKSDSVACSPRPHGRIGIISGSENYYETTVHNCAPRHFGAQVYQNIDISFSRRTAQAFKRITQRCKFPVDKESNRSSAFSRSTPNSSGVEP